MNSNNNNNNNKSNISSIYWPDFDQTLLEVFWIKTTNSIIIIINTNNNKTKF